MDDLEQKGDKIYPREIKPTPIVKDPSLFLNNFYQSEEYSNAFSLFFNGKKISEKASEEQKRNAFLGSDAAEDALYNFYENSMRLGYDSSYYPPSITNAWRSYTGTIQKLRQGGSREDFLAYDSLRSAQHRQVAEALVAEEFAPNSRIARKMAKLMTISCGLEDLNAGKMSNMQRIRASLGEKIA